MQTIGAFEAKTHLSKFLERADAGESFMITKNGRAVAKLVPVTERTPEEKAKIREAIHGLLEFRKKGYTLGGLSLREMREHGRR